MGEVAEDGAGAVPASAGPARGRRRTRAWVRVGHGLYLPSGAELNPLRAWQLVLPDSAVFTHLTAAAEHGLWLPPLPEGLPVFAAQASTDSRPRRPGLRVVRHPTPPVVVELEGVRLATVAASLLACARDLALLDLVVLVDSALYLGVCTRPEIEGVAAGRRPGAPLLRKALALADGRSESPWETLLRILHVSCGVPVEPQHDVWDDAGTHLGRADLWVVGTNALHEYDGGDHLGKPQQRKDLRRGRRLANSAWMRRGFTDDDVLHRAVTILMDADRSLGRPHEPVRIRGWHSLLMESAFSPAGLERLRLRLCAATLKGGHRRHL